jgi:hypothetical protein
MTTIGQIAQSYQHMLAVANGQRQVTVTDEPARYQAYSGRNLQDFINYNSQMFTNLDGAYARGAAVATPTGSRVLSMVNGVTGGSYTNANDAKADFRLLQQAAQRPPFLGDVNAYMASVIRVAQDPSVASQPFTLDNLDSARVFSGTSPTTAPAPAAAPVAAAPAAAPAAVTTAVTNFLTGGATTAEITALKGAVNIADSNPPGQLHGRGGVNGAETMVATRTALGGPLSATNHPDLYGLAKTRYHEITGLPADRVATPEEIAASQTRIRAMSPEQIAEYQSVSYLLGQNETALTNGKINIDGIYGPRTNASIASANTALHPAATPTEQAADASADVAATDTSITPARPRVVVLDMSIENSRGDRTRLLQDIPTGLERQLNTDPAHPIRVEVFNPRDNRDGPQTLTQFMQAQGTNADVVGVVSAKNDGIIGTNNDLRLTFTGRANNVPAVEMTITDDGMRNGMAPAITQTAREINALIGGTTTPAVGEMRTYDVTARVAPPVVANAMAGAPV